MKLACQYHKDIIMVNIECMAAVGPILTRMADEAGIVLSYAYGDQPGKALQPDRLGPDLRI